MFSYKFEVALETDGERSQPYGMGVPKRPSNEK